MSARARLVRPARPRRARRRMIRSRLVPLSGALLALSLFAAGCSGSTPEEPSDSADSADAAASDGGGSSEDGAPTDGGASDGGGRSAAEVPQDPYPATAAPEDFDTPDACSGEGTYFAEVGETTTPELPERAGETLVIEAVGVEGEDARLTAALGSGSARPIEDLTVGESVTIDLWTISVTSVCADTQQVEFDLVD